MTSNRQHVFRHPEIIQQLPHRDWFRDNLPHSSEGVVVDDIDLITRVWGPNFHTGPFGKIRIIEIKFGDAWPHIGQMLTFRGLDELLRRGDPHRETYLGFYIVQQWSEHWDGNQFRVNGHTNFDASGFKAFILGEIDLPGYDFTHIKLQTGIPRLSQV